MKRLSILLIMVLASHTSSEVINEQVDKHLNSPAFYYAVVSPHSIEYTYSKGKLNLTAKREIDEEVQFPLFSITKTFTAVAILQLEEKGKLNLDDLAITYLPQYEFLGEISIRHLLSHQSGLNNPIPIRWIHLQEDDERFDYEKFSEETLFKKAKAIRKPRKKASYSNLNYLVLGEIVAKVSGQSYQEYITTNVLNNPSIGFKWDNSNAVTGYHESGLQSFILGFLLDKSKYMEPKQGRLLPFKKVYLNGAAHGGLFATPKGLNGFLQELLKSNSSILSDKNKELMFKQQTLSNGKPSGHTLGWFSGELDGHSYVHHAGGGGGFYLELRIYPELNMATYVLTNKSGFSDKRLLDKLDANILRAMH